MGGGGGPEVRSLGRAREVARMARHANFKTRRKADMESYNPDMIFHFGIDFPDIPTTLFTTFASV